MEKVGRFTQDQKIAILWLHRVRNYLILLNPYITKMPVLDFFDSLVKNKHHYSSVDFWQKRHDET